MLSPFRETLGAPVNSSVFVKRLPHCDWSRLTTLRSSAWDSVWLPCVDRKWTWESPLNHRCRFMLVHRFSRRVSSRWPGSMRTLARMGSYSKPRGDVDYDVSSRQPSLASAIDVGVGDLAKPHVAAYVEVPTAEV